MDAATGLIYVGNGQYYDPQTGRFLTRDAKPGQVNPYIPWDGASSGSLIIAPLIVLALVYSNKRKKSKWDMFVIALVLGGAVALSLSACGPGTPTAAPQPQPQPTGTPAPTPTETPTPGGGGQGGGTDTGSSTGTPGAPTPQPISCPAPVIKNWLPNLFQITHYAIVLENDPYFETMQGNIPFWENGTIKYHTYTYAFFVGNDPSDYAWSVYVQGTGKANDERYVHTDLDNAHFPTPEPGGYQVHAVYQYIDKPTPKCTDAPNNFLAEDETLAVSMDFFGQEGYKCGDQYYIEGRGDKIYTVTDSGTFKAQYQLDVFVGEQTHESLFVTKYPYTGEYHRVAKVQK